MNLKRIMKYFSSPTNLQNGRQDILYLLDIADFSHGVEFIFKAVIGQYNLQTIFLHPHWKKMYGYPKREKKTEYEFLKIIFLYFLGNFEETNEFVTKRQLIWKTYSKQVFLT